MLICNAPESSHTSSVHQKNTRLDCYTNEVTDGNIYRKIDCVENSIYSGLRFGYLVLIQRNKFNFMVLWWEYNYSFSGQYVTSEYLWLANRPRIKSKYKSGTKIDKFKINNSTIESFCSLSHILISIALWWDNFHYFCHQSQIYFTMQALVSFDLLIIIFTATLESSDSEITWSELFFFHYGPA